MLMDFIDRLCHLDEYKDTGSSGERFTYRILLKVFNRNNILRNVYIKKPNNEYTEIDLIAVSNFGIFVIESKNYSGHIYGNMNDSNWTQILNAKSKYTFYNPIWQNNNHIKYLKIYLENYNTVPYFSYIVFSDICRIKNISCKQINTFVLNRYNLKEYLLDTIKNTKHTIPDRDVTNILNMLYPLSRPDSIIKETHIKNLSEQAIKYNKR